MSKPSKPKLEIIATKRHPMAFTFEFFLKIGQSILLLLLSDLHLDHPKCFRKLLKQHLDECVARGGFIMLNGDTICAMQGKIDKRHNKQNLQPRHLKGAYLNELVDDAVEFLLPYAYHILFIGLGNHEEAILDRVEFDLLKEIVQKIYEKTGHLIMLGEYHGFLYLKATAISPNNKNPRTLSRAKYLIYHNHGTGGDAPVTQGSIEEHRKMTQVEGMDAIWMGHNHNKSDRHLAAAYFDSNPQAMSAKIRLIEVIRTGTYKQEYTGRGFHIRTGKPPKPLGGSWLELKLKGPSENTNAVHFEPAVTKTWHEEIEIE